MTLEKPAGLVPHDTQVSFDFIRFLFEHKKPALLDRLEKILADSLKDPTPHFLGSIKAAVETPTTDKHDFFTGVISGVLLALASHETGDGCLRDFLAQYRAKSANVTPITRAFKL